jgi:hypothetical protein
VAKALTASPGAGVGNWPCAQPRAVGIFNVGIAPCGRAAGMAGDVPTACADGPPCSRRQAIAASPTSATACAKALERLMTSLRE